MQALHSPVRAAHFSVDSFVKVIKSGVGRTVYANASTGNDTTGNGTFAKPYATITKALLSGAAGLTSGVLNVMIAGTFIEDVYAYDLMGKNVPSIDSLLGSSISAPSQVRITGDTTTPNNVILRGTGTAFAAFNAIECKTHYILEGMRIENTTTSRRALYVHGSTVTVDNINSQSVAGLAYLFRNGRVIYGNGANGGVHATTSGCIIAIESSYMQINAALTYTGISSTGFSLSRGARLHFNTTSKAYSFTRTSNSATAMFQVNGYGCQIEGFGSGDTIAVNKCTVPVFRMINGGLMYLTGGFTCTYTDCTAGIAEIGTMCQFFENAVSTYTPAGTSVATYDIYDGAACLSLNEFSGATPVKKSVDADFRFGFDWRYEQPVHAFVPGALGVAGEGFTNGNGIQATTGVSAYRARCAQVVERLSIDLKVASGSGITETVTLYKNGVATSMAVSVTNGTAATTTTNPVTLAAGDVIEFYYTSSSIGTTAAENMHVQADVRTISSS